MKDSEVTKKIGTGIQSAYQKTKENVTNPEVLKANVKWAYEGTKSAVSNGIDTVKDPEFQNKVKTGVSNGVNKMKKGTRYAMDVVSGREMTDFRDEEERGEMERVEERRASEREGCEGLPNDYRPGERTVGNPHDSPFYILGESDEEEDGKREDEEEDYRMTVETKEKSVSSSEEEEESEEEDNIINEESVVLLKSRKTIPKNK